MKKYLGGLGYILVLPFLFGFIALLMAGFSAINFLWDGVYEDDS